MKLGVDLSFQYADAGNPCFVQTLFYYCCKVLKMRKGSHSAIFQSLIQRKIVAANKEKQWSSE